MQIDRRIKLLPRLNIALCSTEALMIENQAFNFDKFTTSSLIGGINLPNSQTIYQPLKIEVTNLNASHIPITNQIIEAVGIELT